MWIRSKSNEIPTLITNNPHKFDSLACEWIEYRKTNPPFDMWPATPNRDLQRAYCKYVSEKLPKEYTEPKFYEFMIKNRKQRPEHCTAIYTLLSNNIENKIIFIDDVQILDNKYAKLRGTLEVNYETVKEYLCEEVDTNNISMLTSLNDLDFIKVCGGESNLNCFVFSDIKNIYRERTPLKQVLTFFYDLLETKFDIKINVDGNDVNNHELN